MGPYVLLISHRIRSQKQLLSPYEHVKMWKPELYLTVNLHTYSSSPYNTPKNQPNTIKKNVWHSKLESHSSENHL